MAKIELRVIPTMGAMVPDYEAMDGGVVRFIGRKFVPPVMVNGNQCSPSGFEMLPGAVVVPSRHEYIQELKSGGLIAADKETAELAGVAFKSK